MAEKDADKEIERLYVIPLRKAKNGRSSLAAPRAIKEVRHFLMKHMKVNAENVWIDDSLNKELWSQGKFKIPAKIRVRAVKFEDGVVEATIPELGEKKSRRELLKEEKQKKLPILRRGEEEEGGEGAEVPGADEYDISPSADGDVKIKKKKAPKEKKEDEKRSEKPKKEKTKESKSEKKSAKKTEEKKETNISSAEKKTSSKKKSPAKKTASKSKTPEKKTEKKK